MRVPTHEDGTCLFWEFATDSYDIGFGVFFEWSKPESSQVSVHISESEEEEEEEDEEEEDTEGTDWPLLGEIRNYSTVLGQGYDIPLRMLSLRDFHAGCKGVMKLNYVKLARLNTYLMA